MYSGRILFWVYQFYKHLIKEKENENDWWIISAFKSLVRELQNDGLQASLFLSFNETFNLRKSRDSKRFEFMPTNVKVKNKMNNAGSWY